MADRLIFFITFSCLTDHRHRVLNLRIAEIKSTAGIGDENTLIVDASMNTPRFSVSTLDGVPCILQQFKGFSLFVASCDFSLGLPIITLSRSVFCAWFGVYASPTSVRKLFHRSLHLLYNSSAVNFSIVIIDQITITTNQFSADRYSI